MARFGEQLPRRKTPLGEGSARLWVDRLASSECPAFTSRRSRRAEQSGAQQDPVVWSEALGTNVRDVDGNTYVDLTSGFGAALIGHRHPAVVTALKHQADTLIHALGDYHPSNTKIDLLERLARLAPWSDARVALSLNGADAITSALKTAMLATGKPGVLAFDGGYHGLSYGPLSATAFQDAFRAPFAQQLNPHVVIADWPSRGDNAGVVCARAGVDWGSVGAVLIEPVQGRGGVRRPPKGFWNDLVALAQQNNVVVIADEIMTGLGRCGAMWQSVEDGWTPDLICVGKALGGGLPTSACLGKASVMNAWGTPDQVPIHTGTFFGHPLCAAAAMAALDVIEDRAWLDNIKQIGATLEDALRKCLKTAHGDSTGGPTLRRAGLMIGVALGEPGAALPVVSALLQEGYIALPAGTDADVLQLLPPGTLRSEQIQGFAGALGRVLGRTL